MINYTIKRSNRKTMAIHVLVDRVEVRVPYSVSQKEIESFVKEKEGWITESSKRLQETAIPKEKLILTYGDKVRVLDKEYTIVSEEGDMIGYSIENLEFFLSPDLEQRDFMYCIKRIYKLLAKRLLTEKIVEYAKVMDIIPTTVKISDAKKRWGSCNQHGIINFAWRLLLVDDYAVDYVVVHELAHMKMMNHSIDFWEYLETILPDYLLRQKRLQENAVRIYSEGWNDI